MKHFFALSLILLTLSANSQNLLQLLKSDSVKLVVDYYMYNGYVNETAYSKRMPAKMFIGKNVYLTDVLISSPQEDSANIAAQLSAQGANESFKNMLLQKTRNGVHGITSRVFQSPGFYFYVDRNDKQYFVEDTARFTWRLTEETKKIGEFNCQKAMGQYGRDSVEAWFTEDIPVNAGPAIISGLPGLILEYYNPSSKTFYKAIRITNATAQERKFMEFPDTLLVINKAQYSAVMIEEQKNSERIKKMIQSGKVDQMQ